MILIAVILSCCTITTIQPEMNLHFYWYSYHFSIHHLVINSKRVAGCIKYFSYFVVRNAMFQLSHLKKVAALFVFIKSTKPNLHYPVCKACLLDVPLTFPWYWLACGTNQVKHNHHFKYE